MVRFILLASLTIGLALGQDVLEPKVDQAEEDAAHANDRAEREFQALMRQDTDVLEPKVDEAEEVQAHMADPSDRQGGSTPPDFCVRIKAYYNKRFKDELAKMPWLKKTPEEYIKDVVAKGNTIFGFPGLGNKVTVHLVGEPEYEPSPEANWEADSSWMIHPTIRSKTRSDRTVDQFVFFTYDPPKPDRRMTATGIAFRGTVCFKGDHSELPKLPPVL